MVKSSRQNQLHLFHRSSYILHNKNMKQFNFHKIWQMDIYLPHLQILQSHVDDFVGLGLVLIKCHLQLNLNQTWNMHGEITPP